jgi:carboxylate-amine ligase
VGVEEELLLFDRGGARLAAVADLLVDGVEEPLAPSVEHEFKQQQIEIATGPLLRMTDVFDQLVALRADVADRAAQQGAAPAALATDPARARPAGTDDPRYDRMLERYGVVASGQLTCGMHVHVSVVSGDEGVAVMDRIRPWLPTLLAMSANSPFFQGQDTGYESYRSVRVGLWPTAGPTEVFGSPAAYDRTVADLVASGAALDPAMIYFDVRLSAAYPTVEIRVMDVTPEPADAVLLTALCRGLVDTAADQWRHDPTPPAGPSPSLLRAADWRAARFGLTGDLVDPHGSRLIGAEQAVASLVDHTRDALSRNGDEQLVREGIERLLGRGPGARRQRAAFARRREIYDVVVAALDWTLVDE